MSHYEHLKNRRDVVSMRDDDDLESVERYRKDGFSIFYEDET